MTHTRRHFLRTVPTLGAFALVPSRSDLLVRPRGSDLKVRPQGQTASQPLEWPTPPATGPPGDDSFPSPHPSLLKDTVRLPHSNRPPVQELVLAPPALAEARSDSASRAPAPAHPLGPPAPCPPPARGGGPRRVGTARRQPPVNPVPCADARAGGLDFRTGVQSRELLHEQAHAGVTVIIVTHNREVARVADRVVELGSGRVAGDGPPSGGRVPINELRW